MTFQKRSKLEIVYDILSFVKRKNPAGKTRILYSCNLSFKQLETYKEYVLAHQLLSMEENNGHEIFKMTERGHKYIELYESLVHLLDPGKKNYPGLGYQKR